jgi:hypothetical protein
MAWERTRPARRNISCVLRCKADELVAAQVLVGPQHRTLQAIDHLHGASGDA